MQAARRCVCARARGGRRGRGGKLARARGRDERGRRLRGAESASFLSSCRPLPAARLTAAPWQRSWASLQVPLCPLATAWPASAARHPQPRCAHHALARRHSLHGRQPPLPPSWALASCLCVDGRTYAANPRRACHVRTCVPCAHVHAMCARACHVRTCMPCAHVHAMCDVACRPHVSHL
jgi:hypothetical protein